MAEHTPGPWFWAAGDAGPETSQPYCDVYVDGGNLIIANVNDKFDREIGHANAELIARAPQLEEHRDELLRAAQELVAAAAHLEGHQSAPVAAATEKLKAAIAKCEQTEPQE